MACPLSYFDNLITLNKYKARAREINIHKPIKTSLFKIPQCLTRSTLLKNFTAKANSTNARDFFTVSIHPPHRGMRCNQLGNIANNANGKASAKPNPPMPAVNCHAPLFEDKEPTSKDPSIGPVQEKESITIANAMKNIPPNDCIPLLLSVMLAANDGRFVSKRPKNDKAKRRNTAKKKMFSHAFFEMVLNNCGSMFPSK